ncbi:MAG: pyrophosphatase [Nitrosomonadaceae bacterium]|nr:pyrophosphatase [Nitrosomonadaceae bacterium]
MKQYKDFVERITSPESNNLYYFINRCKELEEQTLVEGSPDLNVPLFLTAAMGIGSEGGEFQEIAKKIFFQGKPLTTETVNHLKRELGDIMWYWVNACRALALDPDEVIYENISKLELRYGDMFSVNRSENRQAGDL